VEQSRWVRCHPTCATLSTLSEHYALVMYCKLTVHFKFRNVHYSGQTGRPLHALGHKNDLNTHPTYPEKLIYPN